MRTGSSKSSVLSEFKSENAAIRVELISDQARCDQASLRVQLPSEFKSEMPRSELNSRWTRLCAIRLHEELSSVRVQVGNATIRLKLTSDQARCDQARGRVQFCQSSSRKCHAPQTVAGSVVQPFCFACGYRLVSEACKIELCVAITHVHVLVSLLRACAFT